MIYFCADDYGICASASRSIQHCIEKGALHQVSIFPNINRFDIGEISDGKNVRVSMHLNLVEGKCMADADEVNLIADKNANLKHAFSGLLKLSLLHRKEFEVQIYKEIRAQVLFWKKILPEGMAFSIDSHQHTHMIPAVFRALLKVLSDENIRVAHMRIPVEPIMPYIKAPLLYFTYNPVNIIKQWLLQFLWLFNKGLAHKHNIPTAHFFGILFSGKMDEKRVGKILPEYEKLAKKDGKDIEVLFHPGYSEKNDFDFNNKNIVFKKFYLSKHRKTDFESVINLAERRAP